jgi:hypothetical protein
MARWSRAVTAMHRYPSPRSNPTGFSDAIAGLTKKLQPTAIIPTCEEVFHLAMRTPGPALFAPHADLLRRLHSKAMFAADCQALGLSAPTTTRVTSKEELVPFKQASRTHVFKPEYSRFGAHTLVGPEPDHLNVLSPSELAPWVVQSRVQGVEVSFYAVSVNSQLTAFSAYRSTWRFKGGAGYAFEPLDAHLTEVLSNIARTLAERHIPTGQFACDVIVDANGLAWLIECNPRATSGVHMFSRARDLALALLGLQRETIIGMTGKPQVAPALWFYGLPLALGTGRLREWRERRRTGRDVISAPRDRLPVLGAIGDTARFMAVARAQHKSLPEIMTHDIEWNGEEF